MSWATLFERAAVETTVAEIRETLQQRREAEPEAPPMATDETGASTDEGGDSSEASVEPSPARLVADADVLAADLLVGGPAREALDVVRAHSWVVLVASDQLLDDAHDVIAALADDSLAADWRAAAASLCERVRHPAGDHPALASAHHGGAMHVLTFDEGLRSARAGAAIRERVETSPKSPDAFARLFDPDRLYPEIEGGDYPGPDRDPRG